MSLQMAFSLSHGERRFWDSFNTVMREREGALISPGPSVVLRLRSLFTSWCETKTACMFPQAVFRSSWHLHLTVHMGPYQAHGNLLPPILPAGAHASRLPLPLLWPRSALSVPGLEGPAPHSFYCVLPKPQNFPTMLSVYIHILPSLISIACFIFTS